jgi:hypothetical protein
MSTEAFGYKRDEITEAGENYITRSFIISTVRQILLELSKRGA